MQIDFGDLSGGDISSAASDEINFEIVDGNVGLDGADIDWGQIEVVPDAGPDFEISLDESGIELPDSGTEGGVARGDLAYTLLDSPLHRDQLFDELYELEAFLQMRQYEFKSEQAQSFVFYLIDGNNRYDLDSVTKMLEAVQAVQKSGENEVIEHLHRLKHSPK